ncbi:MAG: carotenoid oxygenase family protein [Acidobacteriota bacterium]|nr:carotenoid oxygenase family protein [Acidobacteriota bacterium]
MMQAQENLQWRGIFRDLPREHGYEPLRVEGRLPDDLHGALYRCGPARFSIGGDLYPHWFDGDGAMTAVRFGGANVEGAVRVIDTHWLREEQAANRRLFRGYSQIGSGMRRWRLPKNPANISVLPWDGQLLALWEAGLPIAVDPATLDTRGETDFGGRIRRPLAAHPHRGGKTLYNFGVRYGPRTFLDLYEFGGEVRRIASIPLARATPTHDFMATPRYLIFFCSPVRLRMPRFLASLRTFESSLFWEPEHGTEIIIVPLDAPQKPIRFTVPPFFQWHFVNAWEEGGTIVVDYIPYDDFETNAWYGRAPYEPTSPSPPSRYERARIDPAKKTMSVEVLSDVSSDFPAIAPGDAGQPHDHAWLLRYDESAGLPLTLSRFETKTGRWRDVPFDAHSVPSEAVVIPSGWVLSLVYDGERDASYVAVIDGARPEDGPVAKLWFDHAIPFLFHGAWAPAARPAFSQTD